MSLLQKALDANRELMQGATDPADILQYGTDAIGSLTSMFGVEEATIDRGLQSELDTIEKNRSAWEQSFDARSKTAEASAQSTIDSLQREMEKLNKLYDEKLSALQESDEAITREEERQRARENQTSLESELASLYGKAGKTQSDLDRIQALRKQISQSKKDMASQEAAWAREDQRTELEKERDTATEKLQIRIDAAQDSVQLLQDSIDTEREARDKAYDRDIAAARKVAQDRIDVLVDYYAAAVRTVMAGETVLGGLTGAGAPGLESIAAPAGASTPASTPAASGSAVDYSTSQGVGTRTPEGHYTPGWGLYILGADGEWHFVKTNPPAGQGTYDQWNNFHWTNTGFAMLPSPKLYDDGGWLPPGISMVENRTGRPEPVVPLDRLSSSQDITVTVLIPSGGTSLDNDQVRELREELKDTVLDAIGRSQRDAKYMR